MQTLSSWIISKKVGELKVEKSPARVVLRAVPAGMIGNLVGFFFSEHETIIDADDKLFVLSDWNIFHKHILYLPTQNVYGIKMQEKYLTGWILLAIVSFMASIWLIYQSFPFTLVHHLQTFLFILGALALAIALLTRRITMISIYHGGGTEGFALILSKKEWLEVERAFEKVMIMGLGEQDPTKKKRKGKAAKK